MVSTDRGPSDGIRSRLVSGFCLGVGIFSTLALVWQFTEVYFVFGEVADPTASQVHRYVWTASICITAMVVSAVAALVAGSRWLGVPATIGVVLAVVVSFVFAVPSDRWKPDPPTYELPANYDPCYSGSDSCGPGG